MSPENDALLDCIRYFKPEGLSDIEAALNCIRSKAGNENAYLDALREISEMDAGKASRRAAEVLPENAP